MRFIVDESAGTAVVTFLRDLGHDVLAVADVMPQADDSSILARARTEARIIVTNDKDFGELVFRGGHDHGGVILLRLHDERSANRVRVVQAVLQQAGDEVAERFIVATDTHIRIRREN